MRGVSIGIIILSILVLLPSGVKARSIEVVKSSSEKIPVDISGISKSGSANGDLFIKTLQADLKRSGWFSISQINQGVVSVGGGFTESGQYATFKAQVVNRATGKVYFSKSYNDKVSQVRSIAHACSDDIVRAIKNVNGIASTKILMIGSIDGRKDLYSCDYDGANLMKVTRDGAVCLAPAWGPEGRTIVYTSYCDGYPDVYKIDLSTYQRKRIAGYPGINAGADISPDGQSMALVLSKDGNPDVYIKDLKTQRLTRISKTQYAAEASPSWSPDGKRIVYVSNMTKRPELYIVSSAGGGEKKITFVGSENVAPDWGSDGRIVYSSKRDGRYHVCVIDPRTGETLQVTSDYADYEDPSWAPDGRHIVCSRSVGYNSELYVLDTLGDPPVRLLQHEGVWYSPAWSPK